MKIEFSLPIPPSVNKSKGGKNWKTGQFYNSPGLKAWQEEAFKIVNSLPSPMMENACYHYNFFPKNKTFGDGENYLKAVTDMLVMGGLLKDDKHTILRFGSWGIAGYDNTDPRVEIRLEGV